MSSWEKSISTLRFSREQEEMSSKVVACPECTQRCFHLHRKTRNLSSVPSFFKVMFGDLFSEVLYFPPMFATTVPRLVNKTVVLEDSLGQQWEVTVSCCGGCLAFQEGWSAFSLDHSLETGDFLIFHHITDLHFNVSIYTKTGCEKVEFADRSNMRKRTYTCPVLETTNEELTNRQASCASVGSGSNVALSEDKCHMTGSRNRIVNRDKRPKYQSNDEWHRPLCKRDIVDDSYGIINRNNDIRPVENRTPLFDLFSMEMQIVNPGINENNTTNNVAGGELNTNCASTPLNAAIDISPVNNVQVDIKGEMDVLPLNVSANEIIDKIQCSEEPDKKMSDSDNDPCHDKTIEIPFITSATNSDINMEPFCDTPLEIVKDCQNVPAICNTPSTITRHDEESNKKHAFPIDHCRDLKLECTPYSLEDKNCLHGDVAKTIKMEPLEVEKEMDSHEDFTKEILEPEVKKEILEKSYQSGRQNDDSNVDSIATSAHISCIVAKDTPAFLELPVGLNFSCSRGQRHSEKKVVFLRDPRKRLWPILYHEKPNIQVLTSGWEAFCSANKIQSGDECLFYVEDESERVYQVCIRKCKS